MFKPLVIEPLTVDKVKQHDTLHGLWIDRADQILAMPIGHAFALDDWEARYGVSGLKKLLSGPRFAHGKWVVVRCVDGKRRCVREA